MTYAITEIHFRLAYLGKYLQIVVAPGPYVYLVLYRLVSFLVAALAMVFCREGANINADF